MSVLPDLLASSASKKAPSVAILSGKEQKELTEFPYETILSAGEQLHIDMKSGIPLIYSDYQIKRVMTEYIGDAFEIQTQIEGDSLIAGKATKLTVEVKVKQKNAEYVMIEVPIPAGCSYASKKTHYSRFNRHFHNPNYESYREYFKDKVVICCEKLPIGNYKYEIELQPRYNGSYTLNPAKVEMMYFPVIHANNEAKRVKIR